MSVRNLLKKQEAVIYLVEFDAGLRAEISLALGGLPWRLLSYATPRDFLDALPQSARGCVVANVEQADMSIAELLATLDAKRQQLPLILLCSEIAIAEAVAAMRAGVHDVQPLPVVERVLRRQVRLAIETSVEK